MSGRSFAGDGLFKAANGFLCLQLFSGLFSDSTVLRQSAEKEFPVDFPVAQKDTEQDSLSFYARGVFKDGGGGFQGKKLKRSQLSIHALRLKFSKQV